MTKPTTTHLLSSNDLVTAIKARQTGQVAELRSQGIRPRLAIILTVDHLAIQTYTRMKQRYGADIGVTVDIYDVTQDQVPKLIEKLNNNPSVHAIIIQLPLKQPDETERLVGLVSPHKDVDGLGPASDFEPATPLAILWLISGHSIDLHHKKVLLVGRGRLVGRPLEGLLRKDGITATVVDRQTSNLKVQTLAAEVIITATGHPGLITSDMITSGTIVVDAGVAGEQGKSVGDVDPEVYARTDISITPPKGGVGPLTVCALFENTIKAATHNKL